MWIVTNDSDDDDGENEFALREEIPDALDLGDWAWPHVYFKQKEKGTISALDGATEVSLTVMS